jgi:hypothetical protein
MRPPEKAPDPSEKRRENGADAPRTRAGRVRLRSFEQLDQRTHAAQKAKSLVAAIESDLGGADNLSSAQRELTKRAALIGAMLEDTEVKWLAREDADLHLYGMLADRQRRILESLGLGRVARDVSPAPFDATDRALELLRAGT